MRTSCSFIYRIFSAERIVRSSMAFAMGCWLIGCSATNPGDKFMSAPTGGTTTIAPTPQITRPILLNASIASFSPTSIGNTSAITISLVNGGGDIAVLSAVTRSATSGAASALTLSSDTCSSAVLAVGQACTFTVNFAPASAGAFAGNFSVAYAGATSGAYSLSVPYTGLGIVPLASIVASPAVWDFSSVATGANVTKTFVVSNLNVGGATMQASTIAGSAFSITSDTCTGLTTIVSGGSTCSVTVKFAPLFGGAVVGVLTLNYLDAVSGVHAQTVNLTGVGLAAQPTLTLSPSPYNFLSVATNSNATNVFTVSNSSSASATVGTLSISGTGFTIVTQNCNSQVLAPGASCQVTAKFAPAGLGAATGALTVPYSATDGTPYSPSITLGGTGVVPAVAFSFSGFTGVVSTDTTALTATGVTLRWTAQTAASYYRITQTGGSGGTIVTGNLFPTSVATYNVTGLVPGTTYQYKVNAFDSGGVMDTNNNLVTVTTPSVAGSTFNGWSDVISTGSVYTDIGTVDTSMGNTGVNRMDQNLSIIAGFNETNINVSTGVITVISNSLVTGQTVIFHTDGTVPTGLTNDATYYVINLSSTTLALASSAANAAAGTKLMPSTAGVGNMTLMPKAVVKIAWDLFTFSPTATATSYNIYRSATLGGAYSLTGTSTTNSYFDYNVTDQSTYYYKVQPVVSGVEVVAAVANDTEIKIYVPGTNMALVHQMIANRETCTSLLGFTYPAGINRTDNYSCAYTWGAGYAPNTTRSKAKWDIGYSMVVDRWQSGCKMKTSGTAAPTGGSVGDVYLRKGTSYTSTLTTSGCYIKDATNGWIQETSTLVTAAERGLMRTNYPGYTSTPIAQNQAYNSCQQRSMTGVTDGNGNATLRLMRMYEATVMRGVQGVNIAPRTTPNLYSIFSSANIAANGSCNGILNNNQGGGTSFDGITAPNVSTYSAQFYTLMNGTYLTRNCYSKYEIFNLWDKVNEWTSTQYTATAASNGAYIKSVLDAGDDMIENFATNGTMAPSNGVPSTSYNGFMNYSGNPLLPLFGINTVSTSAALGSLLPTYTNFDFGVGTGPSSGAVSNFSAYNGVILGHSGGRNVTVRYGYSFQSTPTGISDSNSQSVTSLRCVGVAP